MTKQQKKLSDLKDSSLLYEKKLPAFGYFIVAIVSILLISVCVWSIFTPKVYIVKGSGIIESANKNYIMSSYSGEISKILIQNGDYVEKGDLLFTVESTDLNLQEIQLEGKIEILEKQIQQYQKLQKSIEDNINYFNGHHSEDLQYYNQYEVYKAQIEQCVVDIDSYKQYGYSDGQIEIEVKKNEGKIAEIYHTTLKTIGESITNAVAEVDNVKSQGEAITKGQSEYNIIANASGIVHISADYKTGMVIQAGNAIGSIANEKDQYIVKAYIDVNSMPRIRVGDDVDIAVSGLMDSVYGTIHGKLVRIDSDITSAQSENNAVNSNSEKSGGYFRLDIEPDVDYLVSNTGRKYNVTNGTAVETRIQYDEVSYFDYFLESIGILVR